MKLIDLLVSHLGSNGGWPIGAEVCAQDNDCEVVFYSRPGIHRRGNNPVWTIPEGIQYVVVKRRIYIKLADDMDTAVVSRWQYEAAISASQQPAWNGEGLPPVGCECLVTPHNNLWGFSMCGDYRGKVIAYKGERFWFEADFGDDIISRTDKVDFKPIRSEAERKREESISKIQSHAHVDFVAPISTGQAVALYDAIAAGKIPHVTLK